MNIPNIEREKDALVRIKKILEVFGSKDTAQQSDASVRRIKELESSNEVLKNNIDILLDQIDVLGKNHGVFFDASEKEEIVQHYHQLLDANKKLNKSFTDLKEQLASTERDLNYYKNWYNKNYDKLTKRSLKYKITKLFSFT